MTDVEKELVNLDCLRASGKISIQTANSVYEFSIVDPASCAGLLKGGALGKSAIVAVFLCSVFDEKLNESLTIAAGAKAIFLCYSMKGTRRLITSRVHRVSYTLDNQSEKNPVVA
jgi:hypothetical protein